MKILLIDPPFFRIFGFYNRYFPFALATLATFLRQYGYSDIQVYDADFNEQPNNIDYSQLPQMYEKYLHSFQQHDHPVWRDVEDTIRKQHPDIVGISLWTTFAAASFFTAGIAKRVNPECTVVMGGPHATVKAEEAMSICHNVDYIVRGEGEYALLDLVSALEKGAPDIASISGLSYRRNGIIEHSPLRERTVDLNHISFPDRTLLMHEESYSSEDMGLIMTSRGCPYACTYCATNTKQVSFRSADHIMAELRSVKAQYGTTQFTFKDDSFTANRKKVEELCYKLLQEKLHITWECNTRVNLVNEPLLRLMKKAGCNFVKVGIESGSERILQSMNKKITHDQVWQAVKLFRRIGIHWTGYFMMGIPGETEEDIRKTINFMYDIKPDFACIGVYEPFPGTRMFDDGIQRGLVKSKMSLGDFYTTMPNHYYKQDACRQTDLIAPERFEELEAEVKKCIREYNRHPLRVTKMARARSRVYYHDPKVLWTDMKKFLSY